MPLSWLDVSREPTIHVEVDWLEDGTFSSPHADLRDRLLPATLHSQRGRDAARPLGQPMVPSAGGTFHNYDRLLSDEWPGSDLYQLVEPGKAYRQRLTFGVALDYDEALDYDANLFYDGIESVAMATGLLEEPVTSTSLGNQVVELSALGNFSRLRGGNKISTPLYTNIRTDQALGYLLDAAGWPPDLRDIAVGDTTLELWWLHDDDPFSAAVELTGCEGVPALIIETRDGLFRFENRNYRTTATRSTTVQATFADNLVTPIFYDAPLDYDAPIFYDAGAQLMHNGISYTPSFADIRNQATLTIGRRVQQNLAKVWEYGQALTLTPGESRLVTATVSDPVDSPVAPVSGTDYTIVPGGSLASTPTLENVNAQKIGIRFIAGVSGATLNGVTSDGPQLRARAWPTVSTETITNAIDASGSITRTKGVRPLALNARAELNTSVAIAICDAAVDYYKDPRPQLQVTVENVDGQHLYRQATLDVSYRIAVASTPLGFTNGEVWIEQISHQRQPSKLVTTFTCERVLAAAGGGLWDQGLWDSARWGR